MSRDEVAALSALRRWLAGDDDALEEWLHAPSPPAWLGRKSSEDHADDRDLLESAAYAGA